MAETTIKVFDKGYDPKQRALIRGVLEATDYLRPGKRRPLQLKYNKLLYRFGNDRNSFLGVADQKRLKGYARNGLVFFFFVG